MTLLLYEHEFHVAPSLIDRNFVNKLTVSLDQNGGCQLLSDGVRCRTVVSAGHGLLQRIEQQRQCLSSGDGLGVNRWRRLARPANEMREKERFRVDVYNNAIEVEKFGKSFGS